MVQAPKVTTTSEPLRPVTATAANAASTATTVGTAYSPMVCVWLVNQTSASIGNRSAMLMSDWLDSSAS